MASELQRRASSPEHSVFVSANAGTGKTKVLIERVLRLLLRGEVPDTILCVTFTNAAAAEIKARLQKRLADWAVIAPDDLIKDIADMTGQVPSQDTLYVARRLFAKVIDNDSGPRIETTHSFSQSLLSRFPIEAGLPPHFQLLTEGRANQLLRASFASCFTHADQPLKDALHYLISRSDHETIIKHVKAFVSHHILSDKAVMMPLGFVPQFEDAMAEINPYGEAKADIYKAFHARLLSLPYQALCQALPDKMAPFMTWLALPEDAQLAQIDKLIQPPLMKADGGIYAQFVSAKIAKEQPDLPDIYQRLASCLVDYQKAITAYETVQLSRALYVVGRHVASHYSRAKLQQAMLDYDDLIIKAEALLSSSDAMAWVRWKLDFGIHHMLVDEAQDTNPAQWALLSTIADEFFVHEADPDEHRTLFSVGDFKQSIYSFQGANPHIFIEKGQTFAAQAKQGGHLFEEVALTESYRSSQAVLDMVNHVMSGEDVQGLGGEYRIHEAFFKQKFGLVELWPIEEDEQKPDPLPYFDVPDFVDDSMAGGASAQAVLAEKIASHIETVLDGTATGLQGRRYQPRDIMILVNRRKGIYALIRSALLRRQIPVAGADRLVLNHQIEIQDLLALGDICVLQEDDLQLAAFLKSPLIGLSEDDLLLLAGKRAASQSLIAALKSHAGHASDIGQAVIKLEQYFDLAASHTPAEFYETILAQGGREAFYARLGTGVDESLNAFIARAYEFEKEGGIGLASFLAFQRADETEIKRDFGDEGDNEIRIMTIHGAKGLEAPVVYVPDIVKGREPSKTLISTDEAIFWPANRDFMPDKIADEQQKSKEARADEHQRLLYVAMTRASECLFLAGAAKSLSSIKGVGWHIMLQNGFENAGIIPDENGVYRYIHEGTKTEDDGPVSDEMPTVLPDIQRRLSWAFEAPAQEAAPLRPLMPSEAKAQNLPVSIGTRDQKRARQEGLFQHELLEKLGRLPEAKRSSAAASLITKGDVKYPLIDAKRRQILGDKMCQFMAHPDFAPLFDQRALSEFGLSGVVGQRAVVGQIDKLVVSEGHLWLVDFKSGHPHSEHVPESYVLQMALYHALLRDIYPHHEIDAEIIWLDDLSRSKLSSQQMKKALEKAHIL